MKPANLVVPCVVAGLLMLAPSLCFGGVIRADSTYAAYDAAMAGVDAIQADGALNGDFAASGNYLGDGWVLTAAHVANSPDSSGHFTFTINGSSYSSSAAYLYPGWTDLDPTRNDIGLIKLSVTNIAAQTVRLYAGTTAGLIGQVVYVSGHGLTGDGVQGETGSNYELHAGENLIESRGGSPDLPPPLSDVSSSVVFFSWRD